MSAEGKSATDSGSASASQYRLDPVYVHARQETIIIVSLCGLFLTITLVVCSTWGYDASAIEPAEVGLTMGMPTWAFWGLLVPWVAVNVLTILFCFVWMKDDDLTDPAEEALVQKMAAIASQDSDPNSDLQRGGS